MALKHKLFLSTPSARRATRGPRRAAEQPEFLSTPSARRATFEMLPGLAVAKYFYPRPPRGGRPVICAVSCSAVLFLSTPSARRATGNHRPGPHPGNISIHALREEGDLTQLLFDFIGHRNFYPRPPRGGRLSRQTASFLAGTFLSTPSARRATGENDRFCLYCGISIHALREEGDLMQSRSIAGLPYFYPRPPRGGRPPTGADIQLI